MQSSRAGPTGSKSHSESTDASIAGGVPFQRVRKRARPSSPAGSAQRARSSKKNETIDSEKFRRSLIHSLKTSDKTSKGARSSGHRLGSGTNKLIRVRSVGILSIVICTLLLSSVYANIGPSAWADNLTTVMNEMFSLANNKSSYRSQVLKDKTPPTISDVKDVIAEATDRLTVVTLPVPTVTDNVDPTPTITNDGPTAGLPLGTNGITWTAKDDAGNIASALQKVTIVDTTTPLITAPDDVVVYVESTTDYAQVTLGTAIVKDAADSSPFVTNDAPTYGFALGDTTVTWKAVDASGNTATDIQLVSVIIDTKPEPDTPTTDSSTESTTQDAPSSSTDSSASSDTTTETPISSTSYSFGGGGGGGGGGGSSSSDTGPEPDIVVDSTAPIIIPPPFIMANATGPLTLVILGSPTVSDEVDPDPTITNDALANGFPLGITIVTWRATDHSGNYAIAEQRILIEDRSIPSLVAPADIVAEATGTGTPVSLGVPIVIDLVDASPTVINDAPLSGYPMGNTTVTWTATDASGNTATATQKVTIIDTTPPTIIPPPDNVVLVANTTELVVIPLGKPVVNDAADTHPAVTNDAPAEGFPLGVTVVTWTATDASGNFATSVQIVTVKTTKAPKLTLPSNIVVEATGPAGAIVTYTGQSATDREDGPLIPTCTPISGSVFSLGITTVICSATDSDGNLGSGAFEVTVQDTTPPTITPRADVIVETKSILTSVALGSPTVIDLVDPVPVITHDAPSNGFPIGNTTVTWTATDASGNSAAATQLITVLESVIPDTDINPPMIIAPPDISVEATGLLTLVSLGTPLVSDLEDPAPVITNNAPSLGFPIGITAVIWTATDTSGNSANAIQLVTVSSTVGLDVNPPSLVLPPDIAIEATGALTRVALGTSKATDLEDPSPLVTNDALPSGPIPAGPLAYWSFDHDAEDLSGNAGDGIIYGATLVQSDIGRALAFGGRDAVVVPAGKSFKVNGSFSISVWVKLDTLDTENDYPRILEKKDEAGNSIQMFYSKSTHSISFGFSHAGNLQQIHSKKTDWMTDKWYHMVGTYDPAGDRNNMKLYVNGVLDNEETESGTPVINASDIMIGAQKGVGLAYWKGDLDEIRVYGRALSGSEIQDLYNSPFILLPLGTTAVTWTARDNSGNSVTAKQYVSIFDPNNEFPELDLLISGPQYYDSEGLIFVTSQSELTISNYTANVKDIYFRHYYLSEGLPVNNPDFIKGQTFEIVGQDGLFEIEFYSVDSLGKTGPIYNKRIILDNTPPHTSDIKMNFIAGTNGLTLIVHDDISGAGAGQLATSGIYYQFDSDVLYDFVNSDLTTIRMTSLNPDTTHSLRFFSIDNLGNVEPTKQIEFFFYDSCQDIPISELKGVNFFDPVMTAKYSDPIFETYPSYTRDSFERLRENGLNVIRVPYSWEAYEARPTEFMSEARELASTADEFGICVIFDFHHWGVSSYFEDWRMGFPHYLMQTYTYNSGENEVKKFWQDLYNNTLTVSGTSAWELQAAFMQSLIAEVDGYDSVLGYEILNEPAIYDLSQYEKLGKYHTHIAKQLRASTQKYVLFDADRPEGVARSHSLDDLIVPSGVTKVVFAPHVYSTLAAGSTPEWQMNKWKENAELWGGVPIFIGEWASETHEEMGVNASAFKSAGLGWSYWAYTPFRLYLPYYQLVDKDYNSTAYWDYLIDVSN